MAEIPRRLWDSYSSKLQRQAAAAASFVTRSVSAYMAAHPKASVAEVREAAREALERAVKVYGLLAAELAALMYDECLRAAGAEGLSPASPAPDAGADEEADRIARYQAGKLVEGDRRGFLEQLGKSAADRVLARANDTVVSAASRPTDRRAGVRWARVLTGLENCTFCTMLASRGFVYHSGSTASAGRHRNCDCRFVAALPGTAIEGYDLDAVAEQWAEYEDIDSRTHEDGTPWTSAEKRAAKSQWAKEHPVWRKAGQRSVGAKSLYSGRRTKHFVDQALERSVSEEWIADAIAHPIHHGDIEYDDLERASMKVVGRYATVVVNPETGDLVSCWPTSSKRRRKYGAE